MRHLVSAALLLLCLSAGTGHAMAVVSPASSQSESTQSWPPQGCPFWKPWCRPTLGSGSLSASQSDDDKDQLALILKWCWPWQPVCAGNKGT